MRLRPSHEPVLQGLIHLSKAGAGGRYGFVSSHATNAFALLTFLFFALPKNFNWLKWILVFWAILVSYSRIYNGVHYPLDVIAAAILGILLGLLLFKIYSRFLFYKSIKL
jgi:undecaprenyl-diphosphatase